jgi:hypothetical protein
MTTQLYWLYDRHGKPRFLAFSDYGRFVSSMAQSGVIGFGEKCWLQIQKIYPKHDVSDRIYRNGWEKLNQMLDTPIQDALFVRTDYSKPTLYEGFFATEDRVLSLIAHRHVDDAIMAVHQANFMQYYFQAYFTIIKPVKQDDNLVVYPVIQERPLPYKITDISRVVYTMSAHYSTLYRDHTKPALDYVHLNLPSLLHQHGQIALWKDVRAVLDRLPPLCSVPMHGQMTLRHITGGDHNLPVLSRYERAGWHVPFYDWLHLQCDMALAKGKNPHIDQFMQTLKDKSDLSTDHVLAITLLYLLDQIAHDLQDKDDFKEYAPMIDKRLGYFMRWVAQLCQGTAQS